MRLWWVPEENSEEESKRRWLRSSCPLCLSIKDGSLDSSFWTEDWNLFKQCGECKEYTYVNPGKTIPYAC